MSHFTVLVIGENPEEQLAPYQENNMGTCPEKYLKFIDTEDESRNEWETKTTDAVKIDGKYYFTWDERFRVEGTFGTGPDTHKVPDDLTIEKVPLKTLYSTFEEFMNKWHGYIGRDKKTNKYGYWNNPNTKWDWYVLGGRWDGFFKLKNNETSNQASKGDIDFKGMEEESTFAVVKDGKWYQKGQMGWFGKVTDKQDDEVWQMEFKKLIDELPDDTLLSLFDCHI